MAFIGTKSLTTLLSGSDVITPLDKSRIKNGAYELSLGTQVFQTDSSPRAVKDLRENEQIEVKPGQFALLLTKEYIKVPHNKIAFISIKASVKFKGLINVSGFHVDPGFEGKLLFSVYNAGPSSIIMSSDTPYFPIWFSDIDEDQDYIGSHDKQNKIPDGPVEALSQGDLASPNVLDKRIDENYKDLNGKINLLQKDKLSTEYIAKTAFGIVIAIGLKLAFDFFSYSSGFKDGLEKKAEQRNIDSTINSLILEKKKLLMEVDSIKRTRANIK